MPCKLCCLKRWRTNAKTDKQRAKDAARKRTPEYKAYKRA